MLAAARGQRGVDGSISIRLSETSATWVGDKAMHEFTTADVLDRPNPGGDLHPQTLGSEEYPGVGWKF